MFFAVLGEIGAKTDLNGILRSVGFDSKKLYTKL